MIYRVIGLMSGSSLDGLDIAYAELEETGGRWSYRIDAAACLPYPEEWVRKLESAIHLDARDYLLLHSSYGHYLGRLVNDFIVANELQYRVTLIASHGHTTFHMPPDMTAQLGCGAAIAAGTGLPVVSDLRALDVACGGQGAPIVPMGEKLLFLGTDLFLNIGGIANVSVSMPGGYVAFDVCPANRVLNMLAAEMGMAYDDGGTAASSGLLHEPLLNALDGLDYYGDAYPKSLGNAFGTDVVHPLVKSFRIPVEDALRTYAEHISRQVALAVRMVYDREKAPMPEGARMFVTGGGALNEFLVSRIDAMLRPLGIHAVAADSQLACYKEALIMGLLGVLRWRDEETVMSTVTGAVKDTVGGAVWMGR